MRVWRIVPQEHAPDAFSGAGGLKFAARWHFRGTRIVYTAESLSLAALEFFVNLEAEQAPAALVAVPADIPKSVKILRLESSELPPDWRAYPAPASVQTLGTRWIEAGRATALSVPSALIPSERNCLLNPAHAQFRRIVLRKPQPFSFDPRMWK